MLLFCYWTCSAQNRCIGNPLHQPMGRLTCGFDADREGGSLPALSAPFLLLFIMARSIVFPKLQGHYSSKMLKSSQTGSKPSPLNEACSVKAGFTCPNQATRMYTVIRISQFLKQRRNYQQIPYSNIVGVFNATVMLIDNSLQAVCLKLCKALITAR